jgi:hypothetical protein
MEATDPLYAWHMTLLSPLVIADITIKHCTSDGKVFDNEFEAIIHDKEVCRKEYYNMLLSKRNYFQRLFNMTPSMRYYDNIIN